jgi:glycosyltransferase 2 family protein
VKGVVKGGAKLLATVVVTVFVLRAVGLSAAELGDLDLGSWDLRIAPLLGSVALLMVGYFVSAALWGRMVHELGGPTLAPWDAVRLFMIANLGRYVPGKVWQIAGLAALAKTRGVPPSVAGAAAVMGQVIALAGATVVGLAVFFGPNEAWRAYGEVGLLATTLLLLLISIPGTLDALVRLLFRMTKGDAPTRRYGRSTFGVRWLIFYVLNWSLYAGAFWLLYLGLQPFEPFVRIGPAFAAAYVIGYVTLIAPAGVGVRESAIIVFLSPVTTPGTAAALAVVARAWTTAVELVPAGFFWLGEQRTRRESE